MVVTDGARHHDVRLPALIAHFVDALARRELFDFDLGGQHGSLLGVQQREKWDMSQLLGVAGHGSPHGLERMAPDSG